MADIQNLLKQLLNAVYGKDVRQAIHDAIQQCYYDGKAGSIDLEGRQIAADAIEVEKSERKQEIAVERERINQFTSLTEGSTTGDAELQDIRIGAGGEVYASAGEAVRGQAMKLDNTLTDPEKAAPADIVGELRSDLNDIAETIFGVNKISASALVNGYYIDDTNGVAYTSENWIYSPDYYEIEPNTEYVFVGVTTESGATYRVIGVYDIAFYNANKTYTSGKYSEIVESVTSDANAKYVRVSFLNEYINQHLMMIKKSDESEIVGKGASVYEEPYSYLELKSLKLDNMESKLDNMESKLDNMESLTKRLMTIDDWLSVPNKYLYQGTGIAYDTSNYSISDFIRVPNGSVLNYALAEDSGWPIICKYSLPNQGSYVSDLVVGQGEYTLTKGTLTVDEDCYVRLCCRKDMIPYASFYIDDVPIMDYIKANTVRIEALESKEISLPSYYDTELASVISKVRNLQGSHTLSFAFLTDMHNGANTDIRTANRNAIQSLKAIENSLPMDYVVFGGDYLSNNTTTDIATCYSQIENLMEYIVGIKTGTFMLRGNHDSNTFNESAPFTDEMFYKSTDKFFETKDIHMYTDDLGKCIGYVDLENLKVRLIFTNTTDVGTQAEGFGLTSEQVAWFGNVALNFSDKSDKSEWGVVVFAHTYFVASSITDGTLTVSTDMHNILVAFKNGTSYGNYDFTQQGAMEVICAIVGHWHSDRSAVFDGIQVIATMQTAGGGDEPADDGNTYAKVSGTVDETAYDIFTINRESKTINATRFGVGVDRNWKYS